jgi:hypothetical protein
MPVGKNSRRKKNYLSIIKENIEEQAADHQFNHSLENFIVPLLYFLAVSFLKAILFPVQYIAT